MTMRPCLDCGEPTNGSRCIEHRVVDLRLDKASPRQRGYDAAWDKLSRQARRLQPFCADCGAEDDLTTDHTREAWKRKSRGKRIRLIDVEVVCRSCNSKRGKARGSSVTWGDDSASALRTPGPKPESQIQIRRQA